MAARSTSATPQAVRRPQPAALPVLDQIPRNHAAGPCCVARSPRPGKAVWDETSIWPGAELRRSAFAGLSVPPEVILLAIRWYLRFGLSYRDLEELLAEQGIEVDHVTLYRWVQRFTPLVLDATRPCRRCRYSSNPEVRNRSRRCSRGSVRHSLSWPAAHQAFHRDRRRDRPPVAACATVHAGARRADGAAAESGRSVQ